MCSFVRSYEQKYTCFPLWLVRMCKFMPIVLVFLFFLTLWSCSYLIIWHFCSKHSEWVTCIRTIFAALVCDSDHRMTWRSFWFVWNLVTSYFQAYLWSMCEYLGHKISLGYGFFIERNTEQRKQEPVALLLWSAVGPVCLFDPTPNRMSQTAEPTLPVW